MFMKEELKTLVYKLLRQREIFELLKIFKLIISKLEIPYFIMLIQMSLEEQETEISELLIPNL